MTRILALRHAPTRWNAEGRLQGRVDEPLSAEGRLLAARWRPPTAFADAPLFASPLARAAETARLMFGREPSLDARLVEAAWGVWEGKVWREIEREGGPDYEASMRGGLDFAPPGGETPRAVIGRLAAFFADFAPRGGDMAIIVHSGVLRAMIAMATGWDHCGSPPIRPKNGRGHIFEGAPDGTLALATSNIPLEP